MEITFALSPGNGLRSFPASSRILTENLLRDGRFNVHFNLNDAPLWSARKTSKFEEENKDLLRQKFSYFSELYNPFVSNYFATVGYKEKFLKNIRGNYLFYSSAGNIFDLCVVQHALENGIKVVFGGSLLFVYPISEVRIIMKKLGATDDHLKNIIFVKGFVDLTTDLYKIVKNWKDTVITENDFTTFWECERDFIQDSIPPLEKMYGRAIGKRYIKSTTKSHFVYASFMFDSYCWWNKCKFCTYPLIPRLDTITKSDSNKVVRCIINNLKSYGTNHIFIANNNFQFSPKYERILQELTDNGIKVGVYTSIKSFLDKDYAKKIDKYIASMVIGLESMDDFALNYISKGCKREDILKGFDNFVKYIGRDKSIVSNLMFDLPYLTQKDFLDNIDQLYLLKERMWNYGFTFFSYIASPLNVMPALKNRMVDGRFLKTTTLDNEFLIGRSVIWNYVEKIGLTSQLSMMNSLPIRRFDKDGNPLPPDTQIIPKDKAEFISRKPLGWNL